MAPNDHDKSLLEWAKGETVNVNFALYLEEVMKQVQINVDS